MLQECVKGPIVGFGGPIDIVGHYSVSLWTAKRGR